MAAYLGGDPSGGGGDVGEGNEQHENPQHRTRSIEQAAPQEKGGEHHHRNENCSQSHHDVIREVEQRDIVGPGVARKIAQALHLGAPALPRKKAEGTRHNQGIVQSQAVHVRLAQDGDWRAVHGLKISFHGRQRHRLMHGHHMALAVTGGKQHEDGADDAGNHADAYKHAPVLLVRTQQKVERANAGQHK